MQKVASDTPYLGSPVLVDRARRTPGIGSISPFSGSNRIMRSTNASRLLCSLCVSRSLSFSLWFSLSFWFMEFILTPHLSSSSLFLKVWRNVQTSCRIILTRLVPQFIECIEQEELPSGCSNYFGSTRGGPLPLIALCI